MNIFRDRALTWLIKFNFFKLTFLELRIIIFPTNKNVAEKLSIAERTVETYLTNIYNKIGIDNKIELTKIASDFNINPYQ